MRGVGVYSFTLSLDLAEGGVIVYALTWTELLERGVHECYFSRLSVLEDLGVQDFSFSWWSVLADLGVNDFYFSCQSLRVLVFEYIPWLLFPGSGAVGFPFLPDLFRCSFNALPWRNGCVTISFVTLVGISTFAKGYFGFAIGIWAGRGGSGGEIPLGLSGGTLFLGSHTGLSSCQRLQFCPDLTFEMWLVMASLQPCEWGFTRYALFSQSLKQNSLIYHRRQACLGWLRTFGPYKWIRFLVSWSLHLLSVD